MPKTSRKLEAAGRKLWTRPGPARFWFHSFVWTNGSPPPPVAVSQLLGEHLLSRPVNSHPIWILIHEINLCRLN